MRKLSFLVALFVLALIGWGAYWFVGASAMERAYGGWLDARRADGWVAETTALETHGFPNRFDTSFEGLNLADPKSQVAWSAPLFQILSLSYKPYEVIAFWPGEQQFSTPEQVFTASGDMMHGSFSVAPTPALPVQLMTVEALAAQLQSTKGWTATMERGQLSMRVTPDTDIANSYDYAVFFTNLDPGTQFLPELRSTAHLPEVIAGLNIEATISFDAPWNRYAIEDRRPQPQVLTLDVLTADWGELRLAASGALTVDAEGLPSGKIDMQATNWREMIEVARATGALPDEYVGAVTKGLELLAALAGNPDTLDIPLGLRNGNVYIGPIPVGPAPVLHLP